MIKQLKFKDVKKLLTKGGTLYTNGLENLLHTGAKAIYLGGGWWRICGYAYNGNDIKNLNIGE